jgi:hypothetical protein
MALYELVQSIEMVPGGVGFWVYSSVIYVNVNDFAICIQSWQKYALWLS